MTISHKVMGGGEDNAAYIPVMVMISETMDVFHLG